MLIREKVRDLFWEGLSYKNQSECKLDYPMWKEFVTRRKTGPSKQTHFLAERRVQILGKTPLSVCVNMVTCRH